MAAVDYRLVLGGETADREQLDAVEEITVGQAADMAWEARLQVPICVDRRGRWEGGDAAFMQLFQRVRVEVRLDRNAFVPLIDGPIVRREADQRASPGESMLTLVVQDDSIYLNREERHDRFEGKSLEDVVEALFGTASQIADVEFEAPPGDVKMPDVVTQRTTPIRLLRRLARATGMHVNVVPGEEPGRSVGVFRRFPRGDPDHPPLILLGSHRNVERFDTEDDGQRPARAESSWVDAETKEVRRASAEPGALELLGDALGLGDDEGRLAIRGPGPLGDPESFTAAEVERSSWSKKGTGTLRGDCYDAVLRPYTVVEVRGADARQSGRWAVTRVQHTLGRSSYEQSFTLQRNARSGGLMEAAADLIGAIF